MTDRPFWSTKSLDEMSADEWESLCDGCGRCCLHKLEDAETAEVVYTEVACRLLDLESCRCGDYADRQRLVHDCVILTPEEVGRLAWMPPTCAYRLIDEGRDLAPWHPLVSGDMESVHRAGISVRGRIVAERDAGDLEDHIVDWPEQGTP
jgi:uncharacterized protein